MNWLVPGFHRADEILTSLLPLKRILMVPEAGIEPARYRYRWILSPVRLPVSPLGRRVYYIIGLKKYKEF